MQSYIFFALDDCPDNQISKGIVGYFPGKPSFAKTCRSSVEPNHWHSQSIRRVLLHVLVSTAWCLVLVAVVGGCWKNTEMLFAFMRWKLIKAVSLGIVFAMINVLFHNKTMKTMQRSCFWVEINYLIKEIRLLCNAIFMKYHEFSRCAEPQQ